MRLMASSVKFITLRDIEFYQLKSNNERWSPYEGRLSIKFVETQVLLLSDCLGQSSAGNEQLLQLGLLPVVEGAERGALEGLVLCRDGHVDNFPNTENTSN